MREIERGIDPQLWQACAGSMVQIPPLNSKVFYFPQGHAEHSFSSINFPTSTTTTPFILCRVTSVRFLADSDTDEVFAKIRLLPLPASELDLEDNNDLSLGSGGSDSSEPEKPASFAKTLTQSDANNGGGFSVPRYCAETIFPRLDYSLDPPVQTVVAKDVHGEVWKFRHIYRGTPRRHLLTTGWSSFVNQKKLVAGDSIVFLRAKNGDLCVGIRRAKKGGIGNNLDSPSYGWSSNPYGGAGFPSFLREDESNKMMMMRNGNMNMNMVLNSNNLRGNTGKVRPEMVLEAAGLAASGKPFEIVYYPRASTPEFCVKASVVRTAMRVHWCCGMRFKMAFETEDSSRISWFMGTVSSVQAADPIRWPNSPWRLLQVTWDEPDLLQNVKRVSPWLVELVSSMPVIHLSPFSPPRKKLRLPQHLLDFPLNDGQLSMPSPFRNNHNSNNTLAPSSNISAGIQGARHAHFGTSFSDFHPNNKPHPGVFPSFLQRFNPPQSRISSDNNDNLSCLLTMGGSSQNMERSDKVKKHHFLLFGQPIITEQNVSESCSSSDAVSQVLGKSLSDGSGCTRELQVSPEKSTGSGVFWSRGFQKTEHGLDTGHCKVFLESEDVGRTLNLSVIGSYEELYRMLGNMVGKERSELLSRVLYQDTIGAIRQTGEEPFSEFMKSAKRLTILTGSGTGNGGRTWITGMPSTENGLDASNKRGPLSIFA